jgi:hypothetical protein
MGRLSPSTGATESSAAGRVSPGIRTAQCVWQNEFPATWLYITTSNACFALIHSDGIVVEAPPIARRRALGRPVSEVVSYYLRRGAQVEEQVS